jgi:hypothetical protein
LGADLGSGGMIFPNGLIDWRFWGDKGIKSGNLPVGNENKNEKE